jgi:hypothetical protein
MSVEQIAMFDYSGYGPERGRGLAARDSHSRVMLTDAANNPGTALINAIESGISSARTLFPVPQTEEVYFWSPDDPAEPDKVWKVTFDVHGAHFAAVANVDSELEQLVAALKRARGLP